MPEGIEKCPVDIVQMLNGKPYPPEHWTTPLEIKFLTWCGVDTDCISTKSWFKIRVKVTFY